MRDTAPAPHTTADDIIATARRIRARRRAAMAGGAAACLAVMTAAVTALGPSGTKAPGTGVPAAVQPVQASPLLPPDTFSTVLGEYRVGPYRIGPVRQVTAGYQQLPVHRDGLTWPADDGRRFPLADGMITVYRPGVYHPDRLGRDDPSGVYGVPSPLTVAGRPAVSRTVSKSVSVGSAPPSPAPDGHVRTALAWQYAPDAWATYVPTSVDRDESAADALRIAAAVTPRPERELRVPYRLDVVPDGWQTVAVTETREKDGTVLSEVYLHKGPVPDARLAGQVDIRLPGVHIVVMKAQPKDERIRGRNGVHCYPPQAACTVVLGEYLIDVDGRGAGDLTEADIRRIVDGLQPVDIADVGAWLPVKD